MRYLWILSLIWMLSAWLLCTMAAADVKSLSAEFFRQQNSMATMQLLPCNWDGNASAVTIFGYYGADGAFQDVITPTHIQRYGDSTNIMFTLPGDALTHANGMPLHHIDIDYKTTRRQCKAGFGFSGVISR